MEELTPRLREFLEQFLSSYTRAGQPLHYTELAEELNLGKVTVYEKLRQLEDQGYVEAEYHLPEGNRGPGRSTVHFLPTAKTRTSAFYQQEMENQQEDWEQAAADILRKLEETEEGNYDSLLSDLLKRISHQKSPLVYLTETSTAIVLAVNSLRDRAESLKPLEEIRRIGLPGEIDLSALPGIGISLSLVERVNERVSNFLAAQSGKYHTALQHLDEEKQRLVSEFTRRVTQIVHGK